MIASPGRTHSLRRHLELRLRPQPDQVADGEDEVGAVHRVEVQFLDAVVDQVDDLLGADGGRDQAARRRIVLEAVETFGQPLRHARPGAAGEIRGLLEILHRKDARDDRDP